MRHRVDIRISRQRLLVAASVSCAVEVSAYLAATQWVSANGTSGKVLGNLVYPVMEALATALLALAALRASGRRRGFFGLMAMSTALGLCGDVTWTILVFVSRTSPSPSLADVFYVMGMGAAGAALWVQFGSQLHRWRELLDMLVWLLAVAFLVDAFVIGPHIRSVTEVGPVVVVESTVGLLLAMWVIAGLITTRQRLSLGVKLVAWGIILQAASWAAYTYVVTVRGIQDGSWTYTGWQATWALMILGAVSEITDRHVDDARERPARHSSAWVATGGLAVLCASIIPTMHPHGLQITGLALGMTGVLVIVIRLHLSLRFERRLIDQLQVMAETDALTGIANRRVFDEHLKAITDAAVAARKPVGVLVIDIDHFKLLNDGYGHHVGDEVLRVAAGRLASAIRPGDTIARMGGEEFALVAPGVSLQTIGDLAERCRVAVGAEPISIGGVAIPVTISVGAASMPAHARHPDEMIRIADRALYEAKHAGRNRVHVGFATGIQRAIPIPETGVVAHLEALVDRLDAEQAEQEHSKAMVDLVAHLCKRLNVSVAQRRRCLAAARLHDVGKVGTPRNILTKEGPLTTPEKIMMQDHVRAGAELLHTFPETRDLARIVGEHHEWIDGSGYPNGKHGNQISIEARIVSVADAWTAMLADRPYRRALSSTQARQEMVSGAGTQFEPSIVAALLDVLDLPERDLGRPRALAA